MNIHIVKKTIKPEQGKPLELMDVDGEGNRVLISSYGNYEPQRNVDRAYANCIKAVERAAMKVEELQRKGIFALPSGGEPSGMDVVKTPSSINHRTVASAQRGHQQ